MNGKQQINLETDILPAYSTHKTTILAWHQNLQDLMLGCVGCLKVSETVLTEQRMLEGQRNPAISHITVHF